MCPAIHINSRSWLRSSSTHEPSDPPPRVIPYGNHSLRRLVRATFERTAETSREERSYACHKTFRKKK